MSRRYRTQSNAGKKRRSSGGSKPLLLMLLSFLCGYLTSSTLDITQVGQWVNLTFLDKEDTPISSEHNAQPSAPPKPKLEFYTLLTNGQHTPLSAAHKTIKLPVTEKQATPLSTPQASATTANKAPLPPVITAAPVKLNTSPSATTTQLTAASKATYLIQVASFKNQKEAEKMKASLILKGFNTNVTTTLQQQVVWYRVMIGPLPSRDQAEKMLVTIAQQERIKGMIHRMNA